MNYPLISEYVEAIRFAADNFKTLTHLSPVLDGGGRPVMSSGNFAVVFKMRDERDGSLHAVKCFTREVAGRAESYRLIADELQYVSSPYLASVCYLDDELFVDSKGNADSEFPVLLMDWVEGQPLDAYIRACGADTYRLGMLAWEFSRLGEWLLSQPFAHGDLKPDNILVRPDGTLVLVDYDGMYVPAMQGQTAREEGSPDFRHPLRTAAIFNEHIDDFAVISILLSLRAIAHNPALLDRYGAADRLLLSAADYRDPSQSAFLRQEFPTGAHDLDSLYGLFLVALAHANLAHVSPRLLRIPRPEKPSFVPVVISTKVTDEDIENGVRDEYGVIYIPDGTRLLKMAFFYCSNLASVTLPAGLTHIGDYAFGGCENLVSVTLPESLSNLGENPFGWSGVREIVSKSPRFTFEKGFLIDKAERRLVAWLSDDDEAIVPAGLTHIGDSAFLGCKNLASVMLPAGLTHIGDSAFLGCKNLASVMLPVGLTHIGDSAFEGCKALSSVTLPAGLTHIGDSAFMGCENLARVTLPAGLTHIGDYAFWGCENLVSVTLPESLSTVGENPFGRSSVRGIVSKSPRFTFENGFLIDKAEHRLVAWLSDDDEAIVPAGLTHIGDSAFSGCLKLSRVTLPAGLTHIGDRAFNVCYYLQAIYVPTSEVERYKGMLPEKSDKIKPITDKQK